MITVLEIFDIARTVASLAFKTKKCVIIPVGSVFTLALRNEVTSWLASNLPQWSDFSVSGTGKYLGAFIGPDAAGKTWTNAANKWAPIR